MVKSCMLAISSVISFIEKSREKERSKAFNRLKTYSALVKATIKSLQKDKKLRTNKDAARIRKINKRLRLNMSELREHLIELDARLTKDIESKNDTYKMSKVFRQFDNRPSINTVMPRSNKPVEVPLSLDVAFNFYESLYKKVEAPTPLPIVEEFFEEVSKCFKNLNIEKPSRSELEDMVVSSANFLTSGLFNKWPRRNSWTLLRAIDDSILAPISQKALKRGSRGCTDALLKDVAISLDNMYRLGKSSRKNLEVGWIDLKKAFDSPFRSLTDRLVEVLPLPLSAKATLRKITTCWNSKIRINSNFSAKYKIERGLPQGDALSPLLYCMLTAVV
uniref:Reverse transcriptase domain-containing protein n=1 Tax=Parastrongyloides trichosuri TaxID=131310 RepID=A0A0N4Z9P6_PARTI